MSLPGRITKGVLANLLAQVTNAVGAIALVPLFVTAWGSELYGEWLLLFATVGYMTVLDIGMQMYVVNRLTQEYARRNTLEYNRILHSALKISTLICGVAIAAAMGFVLIAPVHQWFSFSLMSRNEVAAIALLLAAQIVISIPLGLVTGIYRSAMQYPRGIVINTIQRVAYFSLTGICVAAACSPITVASVQLLPLLGTFLYAKWDIHKRFPDVDLGFKSGSLKHAQSFVGPSALFLLIQISMAMSLQAPTMIVAAILGSSAVVAYVSTRTLTNLIVQLAGVLTQPLWPDLTALDSQGRGQAMRQLQLLGTKAVLAITLAAAYVLECVGEPLFVGWTRGKIEFDRALLSALLAYTAYKAFVSAVTMVLLASNKHQSFARRSILASVLGSILAVVLTSRFGTIGVVIGFFAADLFVHGISQVSFALRHVGQLPIPFIRETVGRGLLVVVMGLAWSFSLRWVMPGREADTDMVRVASVLVVGATASYLLWLTPKERHRLCELKNMLVRR